MVSFLSVLHITSQKLKMPNATARNGKIKDAEQVKSSLLRLPK
jgi:hypothetical protein